VISVIIVGLNTCQLVLDAIRSCYETITGIPFEVIYIDNGSSDGTPEAVTARYPDVRQIRNADNLGFVKANNQGMHIARGNYVVLLNSDAALLPGAMQRCIEFMEAHPETGVVSGELLNSDGTFQAGYFDFPTLDYFLDTLTGAIARRFVAWKAQYRPDPVVREVDWISGAFMVVRRAAIQQVGMMDERFFMYCEETEWCYRIQRAGWKIHFLSDVKVLHHHRQTSKQQTTMPFQAHAVRSQQIFAWTYYPFSQAALLMIASLATGLGMALKGLLNADSRQRRGKIRNGLLSARYSLEVLFLRQPRIPTIGAAIHEPFATTSR
jgi:GT2 family glycosyltransferase